MYIGGSNNLLSSLSGPIAQCTDGRYACFLSLLLIKCPLKSASFFVINTQNFLLFESGFSRMKRFIR